MGRELLGFFADSDRGEMGKVEGDLPLVFFLNAANLDLVAVSP